MAVEIFLTNSLCSSEDFNYLTLPHTFRVPVGTTPELQDLLFGLLRRNAKDRMPFDVFFIHPFLQRQPPNQQQQAAGEINMLTRASVVTLTYFVYPLAADLPSPFTPSQKSNIAANTAQPAPNNNNNINNNVKLGELRCNLLSSPMSHDPSACIFSTVLITTLG